MDDRYCTIEEVEQMGGLGNDDFMQGDHMMSSSEYRSFWIHPFYGAVRLCTDIVMLKHSLKRVSLNITMDVLKLVLTKKQQTMRKTFYTRVFPMH